VEIESCAGGGGRIDAGIAAFTHRFWTSDNLDAVSRVSIQGGFQAFFPPELMGAHVGASPAHATGRRQSLGFRAGEALPGHFGVELDPAKLPETERAELAGWIGLEDNARPEAAEAVDRLRGLGLKRLVILTGDRRSVAKRVAEQMHFSEFKAEVLPHEKLEMVDELKAKGHRVAVIGDGVNDAPALAAGDISIAMGAAGSDVAIHSASIALMNSNLNRVPFLIELSRRTISVIRQNMIIGGLFILVFMSLAGAGYVTPVWAAFLHIVSGLIVIFNSARLVRSCEEIEQAEADRLAEIARRKARTARIAAAAT
jgi:Cd2+/Zn2+-exporting ATPase